MTKKAAKKTGSKPTKQRSATKQTRGNGGNGEEQREPTGVEGIDTILGGGLPPGRLYLVQGAPGTGKTTLGLQFLIAGAQLGQKTLYISLSQSAQELELIAQSHGWSLKGVDVEHLSTAEILESSAEQTVLHMADVELHETRDAIQEAIRKVQPQRLVYDSLLEVRYLADDVLRYRRELLGFKAFVADHEITAMLIDSEPEFGGDKEIESIAHGIIQLAKASPEYGNARRRIDIKKMRGVHFADGMHDMAIRKEQGIEVYPRVVPHLAPEEAGHDLIVSSIEEIDEMLGGGLEPGTSTLVVGQSGTGKSTLATVYAMAALERGENVAMFLFEERLETFFRRSEGLGMNLRKYHKKGQLDVIDFNPGEIPPGEFSLIAQKLINERGGRVLIIDSFTGYLSAWPQSNQAVPQVHALLKYLSRRGVATIMIVAQHGLIGQKMGVDVDVSFLGDTVLLLRMYEWPGTIRRTITVVKKRHGPHDLNIHELTISSEGITIEEFNPPPPGPAGPLIHGER